MKIVLLPSWPNNLCECCGTMSPLGEHYVYSCHRVKVQKNGFWVKHDNPFSFECRLCATENWDVVAIFHSMLDVEWLNMIPRQVEEEE